MSIRPRLLALLSLLIVVSGLAAVPASAASAAKKPVLTVRDLPAQVRLVPGESLRLTVQTNVTTGYSWKAEGGCCTKADKRIVRVSKGVYSAPENPSGMVGVPGSTSWIITALRPGTTEVQVVTSPPGSSSTMDDQVVGTLTVIVMSG